MIDYHLPFTIYIEICNVNVKKKFITNLLSNKKTNVIDKNKNIKIKDNLTFIIFNEINYRMYAKKEKQLIFDCVNIINKLNNNRWYEIKKHSILSNIFTKKYTWSPSNIDQFIEELDLENLSKVINRKYCIIALNIYTNEIKNIYKNGKKHKMGILLHNNQRLFITRGK